MGRFTVTKELAARAKHEPRTRIGVFESASGSPRRPAAARSGSRLPADRSRAQRKIPPDPRKVPAMLTAGPIRRANGREIEWRRIAAAGAQWPETRRIFVEIGRFRTRVPEA